MERERQRLIKKESERGSMYVREFLYTYVCVVRERGRERERGGEREREK